jgi:hypothetical protein
VSAIPLHLEPVVRENSDGTCVVKGCLYFGTIYRRTRLEGYVVHYCSRCELRARELFGDETAWRGQ